MRPKWDFGLASSPLARKTPAMADDNVDSPRDDQGGSPFNSGPDGGAFSQQFQHTPLSARVIDRISTGVFATGVIVLDSPDEFVLDFMQSLQRPARIGARVVLAPRVMDQFVIALRENLARFEASFGPPQPLPRPSTQRRPSIQELYEDLKLPEEMLSGVYANTVMIGHSASDFFFDFITRFYPTASVSSRVYISAQQAPRMLETLSTAMQSFNRRRSGQTGEPS